MLTIHKELSKIKFKLSKKIQMDYDATSLYPSAMWDEKSVYSKIDGGFCFESQMNDIYVKAFTNQTFNQDGDESAILRINTYNPPDLMFQHLPIKKKLKILKSIQLEMNISLTY